MPDPRGLFNIFPRKSIRRFQGKLYKQCFTVYSNKTKRLWTGIFNRQYIFLSTTMDCLAISL